MNITDKTGWVVSRNVCFTKTPEGLVLLDFEKDVYCDLALLAAGVWLLIKWTPCGITVKEIVDLLETAVPIPRHILDGNVRIGRLIGAKRVRPGTTAARDRGRTKKCGRSRWSLSTSVSHTLGGSARLATVDQFFGPIRPNEGKSENSNGEEDWRHSRNSSTPVLI